MATSVTKDGITWTFDTDYTVGTYANGDYYAVENTPSGGVTINSISPVPSTGRNGHVLNPSRGTDQGFDDRVSVYNNYVHALNAGASLPLTVSANSSLVGSISDVLDVDKGGQLTTYAVLTVLASEPASGSFRPAAINGDYSHPWNSSDINYNALASMDKTAITVPSISDSENTFSKMWYEQDLNFSGRNLHTLYMGPDAGYGKGMANNTNTAMLQLNLDYTDIQKESLLMDFIQYGIDIHSLIEDGGSWNAAGGHNVGRIAPLLVAAMVLDDEDMKLNLNGSLGLNFSELQQTFYVSQADIDETKTGELGQTAYQYPQSSLDMPEFGMNHVNNSLKDNNRWDAVYRDISGGVLIGQAAAARLMGASSVINHGPYFDYAERHIYYRESRYANPSYYNGYDDGDSYGQGNTSNSTPFSSNETPTFHRDFYLAFENSNPVGSTPIIKTNGTALLI